MRFVAASESGTGFEFSSMKLASPLVIDVGAEASSTPFVFSVDGVSNKDDPGS